MKTIKCVTLLLLLSVCVQKRTAQAPALSDSADCPPTQDGVLESCGPECGQDEKCAEDKKCCPNNCGRHSCRKIVIPTTTPAPVSANGTTETLTPSPNTDIVTK